MIRIFKYLKNSLITITLIVMLLVTQAFFDLSLPEYTSKIVNTGIEKKGIETAAFEVITETKFNNITKLIVNSDKTYLLKNYKLIKKNSKNHIEEYPLIKKENLYILNTKKDSNINKISGIVSLPLMIDYMISSNNTSDYGFEIESKEKFYLSLDYMTKEQKKEMISNIEEKLEVMPKSVVLSAAILSITDEYEKIGIDTAKIQTNYILTSGAIMLLVALLIMALAVAVGLLGSKLAAKLANTLRERVFSNTMNFSKTEMKKFGVSSLMTRTTNDINQVQQIIVMMLRVVFYAPIIAVGGILKTTATSGSMGWIIAVAVGCLFLLIGFLFLVVMPKFKLLQKLVDKINLVTREILNGIPVIRAFNNEKHEEERFDKANTELNKTNLFVNRTMSLMMPIMILLMNVVTIAIVYQGSKGIDEGIMQVGDMMAYIQYSMQIIMSFLMIGMMSIMLPRASVSAKRIIEIIETDTSIKENNKLKKLKSNNKSVIEFKNVSFRYPDADEDVLTNISFKAKTGTTTAIIGSTGCGKSTVVNLLPRFYDVTEGSISIDNVDIRDISIESLRKKIGYVPQKGLLFSGTVRSNIKYGNENITDQQMEEALKIAQASDFVSKLENTYESEISQGGTNLSGGQRQRLAIARALAINPDIFIFDDSFSALDLKTDSKLRNELSKVTKDKIVIIVAQRISTVLNADTIIVLEEGKISGIGKHKELLENCSVYKEIALSQLSEEELSNVK